MTVEQRSITLMVNGLELSSEAEPRMTLADFLRDRLNLTGTHLGCEHGVCGACTVLLDGRTVRSCLLFAVQAEGHEVTTVEGLSGPDGELHPIQAMFARHHALQCGFCTPGFLMTTLEYLNEGLSADETEIRKRISGNLCRCTGYHNIVKAIQDLSAQ